MSHGCKEAIGQSEGSRTISQALQGQQHFSTGAGAVARKTETPGSFVLAERFSYMETAKRKFAGADVVSIVADAVHVGSDDWLNVVACSSSSPACFVCPPQARCLRVPGTSV